MFIVTFDVYPGHTCTHVLNPKVSVRKVGLGVFYQWEPSDDRLDYFLLLGSSRHSRYMSSRTTKGFLNVRFFLSTLLILVVCSLPFPLNMGSVPYPYTKDTSINVKFCPNSSKFGLDLSFISTLTYILNVLFFICNILTTTFCRLSLTLLSKFLWNWGFRLPDQVILLTEIKYFANEY